MDGHPYDGLSFGVKTFKYALPDGRSVSRSFILLYDSEQVPVSFTGLESFCTSGRGCRVRHYSASNATPLSFVVSFLNHGSFLRCIKGRPVGIRFTVEDMEQFFQSYANGRRRDDTVRQCISTVTAFAGALTKKHPGLLPFSEQDIYGPRKNSWKSWLTTSRKAGSEKGSPNFTVTTAGEARTTFRDLPMKAVPVILNEAWTNDPMIFFAIILQVCTGAREGEVMSLRGQDSCFGAGMIITQTSHGYRDIKLDVCTDFCLRDDEIIQGTIKRCRKIPVLPFYLPVIEAAHDKHMGILECHKRDHVRSPLFVNRNGLAMTTSCYRKRIQKLIKRHVIPVLLASNDPDLVFYGKQLIQYNFVPHIFRHLATVAMVLAGLTPEQIQEARGDRSIEVSLLYLSRKQDILAKYKTTQVDLINTLLKADFSKKGGPYA